MCPSAINCERLKLIGLCKVEATKFTEVGFHGRDVDQIIRDLVENAIIHTRSRMKRKLAKQVNRAVEEKLLDMLTGDQNGNDTTRETFRNLLREVLPTSQNLWRTFSRILAFSPKKLGR